jgi:polysaccharide biosynthesis/export protein
VIITGTRWAKGLALLLCVSVVSSCALPRTGPSRDQIFAGSVQRQGDAFIVSVNDYVTRATSVVPALGFDAASSTPAWSAPT